MVATVFPPKKILNFFIISCTLGLTKYSDVWMDWMDYNKQTCIHNKQ